MRRPPADDLKFPYNQRYIMRAWKLLFLPRGTQQPDQSKPADVEPRCLSRRGARALRRVPHAAQRTLRAGQRQEIRRRGHRGMESLQHHLRQRRRDRRLVGRADRRLSRQRSCAKSRRRVRQHGGSGRIQPALSDAGGHPRHGRLSPQRAAAEHAFRGRRRPQSARREGFDRLHAGAGRGQSGNARAARSSKAPARAAMAGTARACSIPTPR